MQIIPAIDLYDGQCVRLNQGEFSQLTHYDADPVLCAKRYLTEGATQLHLVDLNGAEQGASQQLAVALKIRQEFPITLQMGGGLRDKNTIVSVLDSQIDRVVLGSIALNNPQLVRELLEVYGIDRMVLAFDVFVEHQPLVAVKGWREKTQVTLWDALKPYQNFPELRILCTDIGRDGMLIGANVELYRQCTQQFPQFKFQASGGVSQLSDLVSLKKTGVDSVIVGKALYEKRFTLTQAMQLC